MSDQSQGPGWWQASDLKWYPPDQVPGTGAGQPVTDPTTAWGDAPAAASPPPLGDPQAWGEPTPPAAAPSPAAWGTPPPPPPTWGAPAPYGVPSPPPYGGYPTSGRSSVNGLAVASLVLGILALITCLCFVLGLPLGIAGAVCGGIALSRISNGVADPSDRTLALIGTILSGLALAVGVGVLLLLAAA